ncbi:hypothetical protein, partial [Escherichia coli]|uniref:hypothetical protein n=1 Tax=Escherichia coli TaxID=562 RepID=UPI001BC99383
DKELPASCAVQITARARDARILEETACELRRSFLNHVRENLLRNLQFLVCAFTKRQAHLGMIGDFCNAH